MWNGTDGVSIGIATYSSISSSTHEWCMVRVTCFYCDSWCERMRRIAGNCCSGIDWWRALITPKFVYVEHVLLLFYWNFRAMLQYRRTEKAIPNATNDQFTQLWEGDPCWTSIVTAGFNVVSKAPPVQWPDFFVKAPNENCEGLRVLWFTLARDRDERGRSLTPAHQQDDRYTGYTWFNYRDIWETP